MNTYLENDYLKIEDQISNHKELIITKHFSKRMIERVIRYQDLKNCLLNPRVIRHEGSYDSYGKLKIKYTLQSKDRFQEDLALVCALYQESTVILITVMYFWEEIGWECQEDGLFIKR